MGVEREKVARVKRAMGVNKEVEQEVDGQLAFESLHVVGISGRKATQENLRVELSLAVGCR